MAHYLVTGGCGFIGSTLVHALVGRGDRVRVLDDLSSGDRTFIPPNADLVVGSVTNAALLEDVTRDVDGCFHLAAVASVPKSRDDWLGTHAVNLTGTITVFSAARRRGIPVVYASSAAVYGSNPCTPLVEGAATGPLSAYGADKLACEAHAHIASHVHGVPTTGFRFFNVYGPRQNPASPYSGVISIFCDRLLSGQTLTVHGSGEQVRDFIYVDDVVRFLLAAMDRPAPRPLVFNVCTGTGTSILALAHLLAEELGVEAHIDHGPERPGDIRTSIGSPTAANRYFALAADTPLREGLRRTIDHLKAQRERNTDGRTTRRAGAA